MELVLGGDLRWGLERLLCRDSRTGVSSTTRLASKRASSSHPAMAAADRNPGLRMLCLIMAPERWEEEEEEDVLGEVVLLVFSFGAIDLLKSCEV